jgi:putative ABC transport system substrate-binding protein
VLCTLRFRMTCSRRVAFNAPTRPETRRRVLQLVLIFGAAPHAVGQALVGRQARIGVLTEGPSTIIDAFLAGLSERGWREGSNLVVERAYAGEDPVKASRLAQDLVATRVDVIVARASTFVEPARRATSTIPIVFLTHNDPLGTGHVRSLGQPGGNITGVSQVATELNLKQLQLLQELLPRLTRVAVVSNPDTPSHRPALAEIARVSKPLGLQVHLLEAATLEAFQGSCREAVRADDQAVLILTSPLTIAEHERIGSIVAGTGLPSMFGNRASVEAGGLIGYGPDLEELGRHAAAFVDKILRGAKPSELPVELPTKFELIINMRSARLLGVRVPDSMRLRATNVIE